VTTHPLDHVPHPCEFILLFLVYTCTMSRYSHPNHRVSLVPGVLSRSIAWLETSERTAVGTPYIPGASCVFAIPMQRQFTDSATGSHTWNRVSPGVELT
jgi:hypothetical protein